MIHELFEQYDGFRENCPVRYFPPEDVEQILANRRYAYREVGRSVNGLPIYLLTAGKGKKRLLIWAQMHGNESTASRAMFDLWRFLHSDNTSAKEVLEKVQIDFIPQLNPDGAAAYTRRNALNIDINRDFPAEQSPEMQVLKTVVKEGQYDFLFNMHDQRTIFHPRNVQKPATLSFLAPSTGNPDDFSENRKNAVQLISSMIQDMNNYLPEQISRFTDEFYPKATGDNFQKAGYATILVECGHYPNDYQRNITRKYTFLAMLSAINAILTNSYKSVNSEIYHQTPVNDQRAFDIIYKGIGVQSETGVYVTDLGIQLAEKLDAENKTIKFEAQIAEVGDLSDFFGHDICHAENRIFKNNTDRIPKIGEIANFELGEWKIVNGKITD